MRPKAHLEEPQGHTGKDPLVDPPPGTEHVDHHSIIRTEDGLGTPEYLSWKGPKPSI